MDNIVSKITSIKNPVHIIEEVEKVLIPLRLKSTLTIWRRNKEAKKALEVQKMMYFNKVVLYYI